MPVQFTISVIYRELRNLRDEERNTPQMEETETQETNKELCAVRAMSCRA